MLTDPQSLTIGGAATSVRRINQDGYTSEYMNRDAIDEIRLSIRHSEESQKGDSVTYVRHLVRLDRKVFATATVPEREYSAYLVMRMPESGDGAILSDLVGAVKTFLSTSNIDAVISWES